tara:strand:- start:265 stop:1641 length:1377 start_codon:yes stop_codon:yes gene_type:complete
MANSYLTKTFGTPTDTKKYTMSVWVKRSKLGVQQSIARSTNGNDDSHVFTFNSDDSLRWDEYGSSSTIGTLKTTRKFRDTAGWYHVVLWYDSANSTAGDRMRMWINGVEETAFATDTNPSVNAASAFNKASQPINIGRTSYGSGGNYFEGYLSHMAFVDGLNVAHTTFGQTDSTSGIWKFKPPTGVTWGTNGFHLKFENSGNLGLDSSSNASNWTVQGNLKQSISTPSNVLTSLNNLSNAMAGDYTIGNTTVQSQNASDTSAPAYANYGVRKGKWYWEVKCAAVSTGSWTYSNIGITALLRHTNAQQYNQLGAKPEDYGYYSYNGHIMNNDTGNTGDSYGNTYTLNDIIGVALDLDNNKLYFHKNGTYQNSGVPTSGSTGTGAVSITDPDGLGDGVYFPAVGDYHYAPRYTFQMNFGEGRFGTTAVSSAGSNGNGSIFEYDVPSGYYALNTKNINTYG